MITDINILAEECKEDNWDGYGAYPVTEETLALGIKLADLLKAFPLADVGVGPDGHYDFDWSSGPTRPSFSLSGDKNSRIAYNVFNYKDGYHGSMHVDEFYESEIYKDMCKELL